VVVDKPPGRTSHDVVSRMRRLAGTRRVGHAGTLDPMATGVLVVGIGRATRLLGHLSGADKSYAATIRLGWATVSDDAQGLRLDGSAADDLPLEDVLRVVASLTGPIMQRPSAVSAIKVEGRRSHDRVRAGEAVTLAERPVVVRELAVGEVRRDPGAGVLDLDVVLTCTSGTYVRALARDLGAALGVGGHLTALRRTRVGCFDLAQARTLEQLTEHLQVVPIAAAARAAFPSVTVTAADSRAVRHGRPIELGMAWHRPEPAAPRSGSGPHALFAPDGELLALAQPGPDGSTQYLAVLAQPPG